MPKNGEDWGKLVVAKFFKKLPKVQNVAQSGHTVRVSEYDERTREHSSIGAKIVMEKW